MTNRAYIIHPSGKQTDLDHRPSLAEASQIVGGYIELLPIRGTRLTLVVNDDGRRLNLPRNDKATLLYKIQGVDAYLGNVIVLEGWKTVG